mmetsp:Transcript_4032/g.4125  ORF Transcript_4032/g.4125 Transcript_4032/m.4125 type:complete len:852 (-) Transcript_4032:143-2698(-)|eukprot:CAMPEP_0182431060 /NCGR_PEP_ID=MMETSP1167-20130531/46137_1 /TAXON_ID=2988 /ORGANISM="Mallomonas Sp, Strain CCMP3275" /LENGTH=851 /DNA_ID=CAMNT_0024616963 /DNA_START=103 /DNA_END=2658 /DNA_ORIENTATION=+
MAQLHGVKLSSSSLEHASLRVKEGMTAQQQAHVFHKEGKNYFDSGDIQGALECFNVAISLNSMSVYYVNRAACHKHLNKHTEAYFDYSFAIRLEPESGSLYCHRGLCAAKLDRLTLAVEDLDEACRIEPLPLHFYCRASIHAEAGDHEAAIRDLTKVIEDVQHTTADLRIRALHRRGAAYYELRCYEESNQDLALVCQLDPKHVAPYVLKGKVLRTRGDLVAAEESLDHAIDQQPDMHELYVERADIRMRMGSQQKRREAIADFDHAVDLINKMVVVAAVSSLRDHAVTKGKTSRNLKNTSAPPPSSSRNRLNNSTSLQSSLEAGDSQGELALSTAAVSGAGSEYCATLGDVLNKRAQAKLLLQDDATRVSALEDAMESVRMCPGDEFFLMVEAVCHQRLGDTTAALTVVESVLAINPNNERALFHQAFCRRQQGDFRGAIESLTAIIAKSHAKNKESDMKGAESSSQLQKNSSTALGEEQSADPLADLGASNVVPIGHVFEMRGALFHGLKAYKMAVKDLGICIALDKCRPEPYFLRGDCHCRLGSYEQALNDFIVASEYGLKDNPSLLAARGAVKRLMGQSAEASYDFNSALEGLRVEAERTGNHSETFIHAAMSIRLRTFIALCQLDMRQYDVAHLHLKETLEILDTIEVGDAPENAMRQMRWTLLYHDALSFYMRGNYSKCWMVLRPCVNELKDFAPDPIDVGAALFFSGICHSILGDQEECLATLDRCLQSEWIAVERQLSLCLFAKGKALQRLGRHEEAVVDLSQCLQFREDDAHALFRRAWSYKALGQYENAAKDFELAKSLRFDDPNFSIRYRLIHEVDYMEIESDPDLMEPFPSLLPLPGVV